MKNKKMMIAAFCLMAIGGHAEAQRRVTYDKIPDALMETLYASKEDTRWFTEAKFGVFVHWGPYVLKRVPASWGRWGNRPGAGKKATDGVPADVYDALYKEFNPVKFDADKWIKMVKDAGANYFIFTTKHHDGFCMFDARNTDYKITNTPFGRDVCKEIADACHKYGIRLFWYYSQPDWHHPDCLTENNENYREYMYEHLRQLLTDYGKVSGLFFDGLGTKYSDWDTPNMVKMIRELQPGIVINRRWGGNLPGGLVNGDYDNPEQEFGMFERERPWEMCSTISNAWSWTGKGSSKTFFANLNIFINTVGSGGNLALNAGPTPLGEIFEGERIVYEKMGDWLGKYGEAIYGTLAGPYKPGVWGVSTCKGSKVYLHVTSKFLENKKAEVELPSLDAKVKGCRMLTGGDVAFKEKNGVWSFTLKSGINPLDNIIVLELDKDAAALPLRETLNAEKKIKPLSANASSEANKKNTANSVIGKGKEVFAEGKKHKIWWAPKKDDDRPWIEVCFDKEYELSGMTLAEQIRNCSVRAFRLSYKSGGNWKEFYCGTEIGMLYNISLEGVRTNAIRLDIERTVNGGTPNIGVIDCYMK